MVQQILSGTPVWVWVVLVLLIARGLSAARDRETALGALFVLPLVMLCISIQSIAQRFGVVPLPWGAWLAGFVIGTLAGWASVARSAVALSPKGVKLAGSFWPLALILGVFCVRYASEVLRAMHPDLMATPLATALVCLPSGLVSGLFVGRVLRNRALHSALRQTATLAAPG